MREVDRSVWNGRWRSRYRQGNELCSVRYGMRDGEVAMEWEMK